MIRDEIIAAWNAQADYMNTWNHLGEDEKLEWAMKLEREACANIVEAEAMQYAEPVWAFEIVNDIRARGQS